MGMELGEMLGKELGQLMGRELDRLTGRELGQLRGRELGRLLVRELKNGQICTSTTRKKFMKTLGLTQLRFRNKAPQPRRFVVQQ